MSKNEEFVPKSELSGFANVLLLSLGGICSLIIVAWPASRVLTPEFKGELLNHSHLLGEMESKNVPIYSIWYFLQKLIVGRDLREDVLTASGLLLIGAFGFMKGVFLTSFLKLSRFNNLQSFLGGILLGTAVAIPIPFLQRISPLANMNIPTEYLGTIPANTFMSATQLVANTFVLPAFFMLQLWARSQSKATTQAMILTCLLATLAKPGIALALLIGIIGHSVYLTFRDKYISLARILPVVVSIFLLLAPTIVISHYYMSGHAWMKLHAVLAPFHTWQTFSAQIPQDFIASFAFPISVLISLCIELLAHSNNREIQSRLVSLFPCWHKCRTD